MRYTEHLKQNNIKRGLKVDAGMSKDIVLGGRRDWTVRLVEMAYV